MSRRPLRKMPQIPGRPPTTARGIPAAGLERLGDLLFTQPAATEVREAADLAAVQAETAAVQERFAVLCGAVEPAWRLRFALDAARQISAPADDLAILLVNDEQVDCYVVAGSLPGARLPLHDVEQTVEHVVAEFRHLSLIFFCPTDGRWLEAGSWFGRSVVLVWPDSESIVEAYREVKTAIINGAEPPAIFVVGADEPQQVQSCHRRLDAVAERFLGHTIPLAGPQTADPMQQKFALQRPVGLIPVFAHVRAEQVWPVLRNNLS